MIIQEIRKELHELQDHAYRSFQSKLIPTLAPAAMIGVRTPALRALAKELAGRADIGAFLDDLPHAFFEEDQLHAFIISGFADYAKCMDAVDRFLPYVNNWATCDQMSPAVFKKRRKELLARSECWLSSDYAYTVRFGIRMLMDHFLDEEFDARYLERVANVQFSSAVSESTKEMTVNHSEIDCTNGTTGKRTEEERVDAPLVKQAKTEGTDDTTWKDEESDRAVHTATRKTDEYYVNMMIAWYFATALAKQYEATLPFIQERRLDAWTHNKAIQKAIESRRISQQQKAYLRTQKIKKG